MKSPTRPIVLVTCLGMACLLLAVVIAGAKPAADPPIVLSYRDTPIFMDPHEHNVAAIAFSADGKTLATGSADGYLRLWDAATGRLQSIHGEDATRGTHGLAFSPDGRTIAAVGGLFGKDAELWDMTSGRIVREFAEPTGAASAAPFTYKGKPIDFRVRTAVAISPDGRILATAPDRVMVRELSSGNILATLDQPAKGVKAIAFSPDGTTLATAGEDRRVRLWSVPEGNLTATLTGPTQPLFAVAYSPDGSRIVATGSGKRSIFSRDETPTGYLWSWERSSGAPRTIEIGNVHVRQVAFVGPSTVVVAAGSEVLALDLQAADSSRPRKVRTHSEDVLALAVSPDGRLVASGGADRTVDVVDLASGKLVYRLPGLTDVFSSVAASRDGQRFATATIDIRLTNRRGVGDPSFAALYTKYFSDQDNTGRMQPSEVRIWRTDDGGQETKLPLPPCQVNAVEFLPGRDELAMASWTPEQGGRVSLWKTDGEKSPRDLTTSAAEVLAVAVSADGRTLASGDAAGNLEVWDIPAGAQARSEKHEHAIEALAFSPDGKLLAAGDGNKSVRVMDPSTGKITRTLRSRSYIESLDFSPDANLLAAGTRDPGLELWDLRTDAASRTLKASGDHFDVMPGFVAFSPDGHFVACGGHGKDIAVFDAASGALFKELSGHAHPATAVAFLPDGRLVSGGEERMIKLWDVNAGTCLASWVVVPADMQQHWDDQWVGVDAAGNFVGSTNLDRLAGWITGGDRILGAESLERRRRVERLFQAAP